MKHPQNRYERKQLEERHKLKRRRNRPAVDTDVEVQDEDAYNAVHGEFLGYQKAKVLYDD